MIEATWWRKGELISLALQGVSETSTVFNLACLQHRLSMDNCTPGGIGR